MREPISKISAEKQAQKRAERIARRSIWGEMIGNVRAAPYGEPFWSFRFHRDIVIYNPRLYVAKAEALGEDGFAECQVWLDGKYQQSFRVQQGENLFPMNEVKIEKYQEVQLKMATSNPVVEGEDAGGGVLIEGVSIHFEVSE